MKKVLLISFRKTYSVFSLARHAILEITSSIQTHTLLGYLAPIKKSYEIRGLEALYVWPAEIIDLNSIEEEIAAYAPDIVAVSLLHVDFGAYLRLRDRVDRRLGNGVVWIAGGYLPTSLPDESLRQGRFDYLIVSHGEVPFRMLLDHLAEGKGHLDRIPGLAMIKADKMVLTPPGRFIEEERNVRLRYEPYNVDSYIKESWQIPPVRDMRYLTTWFSRGCPCNCGFCLNRKMNLGAQIVRPPDLVIDEILEMNASYGVNYVFFADENFLVNRKAAQDLLERMAKRNLKKRVRFTFMTNIGSIASGDGDTLDLLREAGAEEIQFGVESGSRTILEKMNKSSALDLCQTAFQRTSEKGIMTQAMLVLGYEGENTQSLEETRRFIRTLKPDRLSYFFSIAFPGTTVFDYYASKAQGIPLFFFDTDFPVFPIASLEQDLATKGIEADYEIDPAVERIFKKYRFSFSNSQKYLMAFREKIMHEYYISDIFIGKQREIFERRIRYGEDVNLLLRGARQWFNILEKSIGFTGYAETILAILMQGGHNDGEQRPG